MVVRGDRDMRTRLLARERIRVRVSIRDKARQPSVTSVSRYSSRMTMRWRVVFKSNMTVGASSTWRRKPVLRIFRG